MIDKDLDIEVDEGNGKTALVFLTGAVIGAGVALLFAPKTGKETRLIVGDWLEKAGDKSKDYYEKGKDSISGLFNKGKKTVGKPGRSPVGV